MLKSELIYTRFCDHCGTEIEYDFSFLHLKIPQDYVFTLEFISNEEKGVENKGRIFSEDMDFCSVACIGKYFQNEASKLV